MNENTLAMRKPKGCVSARSRASLPAMSVISSAEPRVLRIKVYKPSDNNISKGYEPGASKKLCIDPRLTTFRIIQCLISQAFDIKSDFTVYAVRRCSATGLEKKTAIWSDGDLEESIRHVTSDSYLRLSYELASREEGLDDWDFVALNDYNSNIRWFNVDNRSIIATVKTTSEKKPSALHKAINWMYGGHERRGGKPVGEDIYKGFFDHQGRLIDANGLRQAIYENGVQPSFRKIVWRHLLNIFPADMTRAQRAEYLKDVSVRYEKLKGSWEEEPHKNENITKTMHLIHTDVLRTDRNFGFYADSSDGNVNLQALYRIIMTYCVSHPNTKYRQGMNEFASTILYVMRDESLTYICFCSIMRRIQANFSVDGVAIATRFHHLTVLLRAVDPVYWSFLESCDAVSLFFTYRWLLLECKREFPFNDALRVLEVMWATLPIVSEPPFLTESSLLPFLTDDTSSNAVPLLACRPLQRHALSCPQLLLTGGTDSCQTKPYSSSFAGDINNNNDEPPSYTVEQYDQSDSQEDYSKMYTFKNDSKLNLVSLRTCETSLENSFSLSEISEFDSSHLSTCSESNSTAINTDSQSLSSTNWTQRLPISDTLCFEEENPFLLFLCISILLSHRSYLLKQKHLDEQEIAMHFDRYRRRHDAEKQLTCARNLYSQYIQWTRKKRMIDDLNRFSAS